MGDTYPRFKIAAVQAASVFFDREKTVDKAVRFIEEAADKGAVIIGFPELFIPGHPGAWYYAKKSNPLPAQGALFTELVKNSVKIPSPATERLCRAARQAHAYVVTGMSEADALYPGTLYIAQLFISDQGEILGVHRKLVPTNVEKLIYTGGDGSFLNVYDTPYGKISAMNCGEHAHSLYKYALLAMGTQIHIAAWPSFPNWSSFPAHLSKEGQQDSIDFRVRQFAHEGKIFVISSCGVTDAQNIAFCCDTQKERESIVENSGGASSIIGSKGEHLAGPLYEGEGVLVAEVSLEEALPGKQMHNVLGHYTRWDVLSLNFNRERMSPFKNAPPPDEKSVDFRSELREIRQEIRELREKWDKLGKSDAP
ncbi:MAG: carbon-nitrogen hydrolase family protein [Chloroflexota bacterium]